MPAGRTTVPFSYPTSTSASRSTPKPACWCRCCATWLSCLCAIAARSRDLIDRARQRKLTAPEMQGGTFTITNLGAFGIDAFTPIINVPEAAILGVGRIRREPVARGEQIIARDMLTLSLTFDHRIVDGAPAARFLQRLGQLIQNPGPTLIA